MFVHHKQGLFLSVHVAMKMAGRKHPWGRNRWKMLILMNPHHFFTTFSWDALNVNANRMKSSLRYVQDAWIKCFCWATRKFPGWEKTSRKNSRVVVWNGRTCSKMRWEILWAGKQKSGAALQSFRSLLVGWSPILKGRTWISWIIIKQLFTNCLEMLVLGKSRETRHFMVRQQTCKSSHTMDSGMRQTFGKIDFTHSSHKWLPTTLSTGFIPRLRFCWRPWGFEINLKWRGLLCFGKPNMWMCKKQKSVSHSTKESEIISLDAGLRMDGLLQEIGAGQETIRAISPRPIHPLKLATERFSNCQMWMTYPPTHSSQGHDDTRVENPELRLIGCWTESI